MTPSPYKDIRWSLARSMAQNVHVYILYGMLGRGWGMVSIGIGMDYLSFFYSTLFC